MENTMNTEATSNSTTNIEADRARDMEIASEILRQVNALDFWARARWGVKEKIATTRGLRFNCNKRIRISIVLDASDTYSIEIGRLKGKFSYVKHAELSDVYAEDLVRIIDGEFSKAFGSL
jgi:hypothetical protein